MKDGSTKPISEIEVGDYVNLELDAQTQAIVETVKRITKK